MTDDDTVTLTGAYNRRARRCCSGWWRLRAAVVLRLAVVVALPAAAVLRLAGAVVVLPVAAAVVAAVAAAAATGSDRVPPGEVGGVITSPAASLIAMLFQSEPGLDFGFAEVGGELNFFVVQREDDLARNTKWASVSASPARSGVEDHIGRDDRVSALDGQRG